MNKWRYLLMLVLLCVAFVAIYKAGIDVGSRQMARHLLNPAYYTKKFEFIAYDEAGEKWIDIFGRRHCAKCWLRDDLIAKRNKE